MLIEKLIRHLYKKENGSEDEYTIIYPYLYMDDIYTDFSLSEKISLEVNRVTDKISQIKDAVDKKMAPVRSICDKIGDIKLDKSDIKSLDGTGSLDKVNNTSDMEKPVSDLYRELIVKNVNEVILPMSTQLTEDSSAFRYHVTGNGGLPVQNNPHRDNILVNIYHNGVPVQFDPENIISIQDVQSALLIHNDDPLSHKVILDLIGSSGSISTKLKDLQEQTEQILQDMHEDIRNSTMPDAVDKHNKDPLAHPWLLEQIQLQGDRLNTVHDDTEKPEYEYIRYKVNKILGTKEYTNEYPSVLATGKQLLMLGNTTSFTDTSRNPYVQFVDDQINLGLTDGGTSIIKIPTRDPNSKDTPATMRICDLYFQVPEQLPEVMNKKEEMAIALLPQTALFCWRWYNEMTWGKFKVDYGLIKRNTLLCYVGYSDEIPSKTEVRDLKYGMAGLHFGKYNIGIYNSEYRWDSESYEDFPVSDRIILGNLQISRNEHYVDPDTRALWIDDVPYVDEFDPKYALTMKSIDLDEKPVQDTPVNIGYPSIGPTELTVTQDTEGYRIENNMNVQIKKMTDCLCGITFEGLDLRNNDGIYNRTIVNVTPSKTSNGVDMDFVMTAKANNVKMHTVAYNLNVNV